MDTQTPKETSHPLIWTIALVVFMLLIGFLFSNALEAGRLQGMQHGSAGGSTAAAGGDPTEHQALVQGLLDNADAADARGKEVYATECASCHGADGQMAVGGARKFGNEPFKNDIHGKGAHPYSMFDTVTNGFGTGMPKKNNLPAEDRYAVIHYIREKFIGASNPDYVAIDAALIADLPVGGGTGSESADRTGPHPATLAPTIPVYGVLAETVRKGNAQEEQAHAYFAGLSHSSVRAQELVRCAHGPLAVRLMEIVQAQDATALSELLTSPSVSTLSTAFSSISQKEIQLLMAELTSGLH